MRANDDALWRAQRGDQGAFEEILSQHENMIYRVCLHMCGNREDAMDIAQETAVRLWRGIGTFNAKASLSTWIYRIAINACLDHLRRRKEVYSIEALGEEGYAPPAPAEEGPEAAAVGRESLRGLGEMILRLPREQRAAVILRDVQDLTYEEVAQTLGVNLNTAKSRISRGRKTLRDKLAGRQLFHKGDV